MAETPNSKKLFDDFPPVSTEQWEEKIHQDLKGADYFKKLVWNPLEGFPVQPYYRSEHLKDKEFLAALPGEFPYIRGVKTDSNNWEISQEIKLNDIEAANQKSLFILDRGISSLGFITPPFKDSSLLKTQADINQLLENIQFDCIKLNFVCGNNASHIVKLLSGEAISRGIDQSSISGSVDFDPLGYLTTLGNWNKSEADDFTELGKLIHFAEENLSNYKVLGINGYFFTNAGASAVQELGYSLAMAAEYFTRLTESGFSVDTIARHIQLNLGVGSSYFMEIAKFRAIRFLWAKLIEAYSPEKTSSLTTTVHATTTEWNQTIYDPYVNVLRATTESMAAVLGGADSLTVRPFNYSFSEPSKFSGRIARNIQIILKEEAYLGKVIDPSAGSYYIENLTSSIIEEAWKIFLQIDEEGGYLQALKKGIVQYDIETTAEKRRKMIATRREILLGTNQYANTLEQVSEEINRDIAFKETITEGTLINPIKKLRGAIDFEKLRLATENLPEKPVVFLLTYGNLTMRKARAGFSSNFFAGAGYEIIDSDGFSSAQEGVNAALKAKASIIVVCSSDDEYDELVPEVAELIGEKAIIVVAGAPPCMEELQKKGIEHFIHLRSNILESLTEFHEKMGIKIEA